MVKIPGLKSDVKDCLVCQNQYKPSAEEEKKDVGLCPRCDQQFISIVASFLVEYPLSTADDFVAFMDEFIEENSHKWPIAVEILKISNENMEKIVLRLAGRGSLEKVKGKPTDCKRCGRPIQKGALCPNCATLAKLQRAKRHLSLKLDKKKEKEVMFAPSFERE